MRAAVFMLMLPLAACESGAMVPVNQGEIEYLGTQTNLFEGDLVQFGARVRGVGAAKVAVDYAECAAAQYALIRGYGFARHLRTNVAVESGIWTADAVYSVSPSLPPGLRSLDAEVVVAACAENEIPTV